MPLFTLMADGYLSGLGGAVTSHVVSRRSPPGRPTQTLDARRSPKSESFDRSFATRASRVQIPDSLTEREREVLGPMAKGRTNQGIAEAL